MVRLTKRDLPKEYGPLQNAGLLLLVSVVGTVMGLRADSGAHHPLWHALAYGLPLGVAGGLIFVPVWMKNASHFLSLPPLERAGSREGGLFRFIPEWRIPEARQTTTVLLCVSIPMGLIDYFCFWRGGMTRRGMPEVGPHVLAVTSFGIMWAIGYLLWWWRLPAE